MNNEVHSLPDESWDADGTIAACVASRICHDLISPLGAIANGVELMTLSGAERTPEFELIAQSVDSANARLRFFRLAYGAASGRDVGRGEVTRTLAALSRGGRITYDWTPPAELPRAEVKTVFLLIQCLEATMPAGGRIQVTSSGTGWEVVAAGPRLRLDLPAWQVVGAGPVPKPAGATHIQFTLLGAVLAERGQPFKLHQAPDRIVAHL
ncbi:histidine phosphotransferase family protein [Rubellimicrobium arenae]|uniref:histidine phosphotransferase family protein n=1 Tax=Rubellimicrobium arenae TaxID=2817372 RepID=UPI001B306A42|nr:histidine phosphotransferase family protein [Rubellimicrobium arenae]